MVGARLRARRGQAGNSAGERRFYAAVAWAHCRGRGPVDRSLPAVTEQLLAFGASVNAADNEGRTLITRALELRQPPLLHRLLARGASLTRLCCGRSLLLPTSATWPLPVSCSTGVLQAAEQGRAVGLFYTRIAADTK